MKAMNFRYKPVVALLTLLALVYFTLPDKKPASFEKKKSGSPMGTGTPDDPSALQEWEHLRLADPSTGEIPAGIRKRELAFAASLPKNFSRNLTWTLIGPKNLGGRTRALALDVRNENIILAGGVTGGVWRSADAGVSFSKTTDPGQLHSVTSLAQDIRPGKEDTWYMGTGEYYAIVSGTSFTSRFSGDGIFKSSDNGQTWTQLASTASGTPQTLYTNGDMDFVWRVVTDHTDTNDVVLAAVYNGIKRSADGGNSWTNVLGIDTTNINTSDYTDIIITPNGTFFAALSGDGPDKGIYRSDDGITWTNITPSTGFPSTYYRVTMAANPQNENAVMFVMESPGSGPNDHSIWKYTYLSGNGSGSGGMWENRSSNLPNGTCTGYFDFDFGYFHTQGGYDMFVAFHPTDSNTVFIGGTNLYRSSDQFTTSAYDWIGGYQCAANPADYVYPGHHPDQHGMIFLPSNTNTAISFNDGGIFKSTNVMAPTVSWSTLNNGYVTSQFYTVSLEEGDVATDFLTAGAQDNGTWFTNANHMDSLWKWVFNGDGSYCEIPYGRNFYVLSIQQGKIYKVLMDDNGDTTATRRIDPTGGPPSYPFINSFIMDPNNNNRLYVSANNVIWRNDDLAGIPVNGDIYNTISTNWTKITQSTISGALDGGIVCIEMPLNIPDVVYYGTNKSKLFKLTNASGATPVKSALSTAGMPANSYISSIAANPFDGNELLVTFSNYGVKSIFYSSNGGTSFADISGNLEEFADGTGSGPAVYWSTIYPSSPKLYLVGTSIGLFSTDSLNGANTVWVQEGPNDIGNVVINMIKARTFDGKIAVATHGNGIYTSQLTPVVGLHQNLLEELTVHNYPNPFIDWTTIEFSLEKESRVKMRIYDMNGKMIYSAADKNFPSGKHILTWNRENTNGQKAASGTYLLYMEINGKKLSRKLIVE